MNQALTFASWKNRFRSWTYTTFTFKIQCWIHTWRIVIFSKGWNAHLHFNLFHRILGSNNISRFRAQDLFLPIGPSPSLLIHCLKHFFLMLEVVCCLLWTPNEGQRQKACARGWCLKLEVVGIPNCHIFSSFINECFWGTLVVFRSW